MLSIITAFYNSSRAISELIKCIQKQSNKHFEWIIIDDCSKDEEKNKLLMLMENVSVNVKIEHNAMNLGPGKTRANGLKIVKGDYVVFVDSDDLISEDFVDTILSTFKCTNAQIVAFDYARVNGSKIKRCDKIENLKQGLIQPDKFILYSKSSICGCAFNKTFLTKYNITFPDLYRYEDWVFNIRAATRCSGIYYVKRVLYYYIFEPTSLVHSRKYDAGECSIEAFNLIEKELESFDKSIMEVLYSREVLYVNAVSKAKIYSFEQYRAFMNLIKKEKYCSTLKSNGAVTLHQKLIIKLIYLKMYRILWYGLNLILK